MLSGIPQISFGFPALDFEQAWPRLSEAAAIGDELTKEDAVNGIRDGTFVYFRRGQSAALVAIHGDALRIGVAGGELNDLREVEADIIKYARKGGFKYIDIVGRPGWEKALPGYNRVAVLLRKEVP